MCDTLTHLLQNTRVDHFGHLLVELGHLTGVDVLVKVAALEETLYPAHLLHDLAELAVLRQ